MQNRLFYSVILILSFNTLCGQNNITGIIINETTKLPVEYVNIGIVGENIGTVSDEKGVYNLLLKDTDENHSILFSCIGYESHSIKISELKKNKNSFLKEKVYSLGDVYVKPHKFKQRVLGITTKSKALNTGFEKNMLGYEAGLLMNVKKRSVIKEVHVNISACSYDTIFYRLNIYEVKGKREFENILREPIFIKVPKNMLKDGLHINLEDKNIIVDGNFLVTLEHIKELGNGGLWFCASLKQKTFYRKTSQGEWQTAPIGISLSVLADVEK